MRRALFMMLSLFCLVLSAGAPRSARAADAAGDPGGYLEELGYTVDDISDGTNPQGMTYAMVTMEWESKDVWSADTTGQVVSGFYALRTGYPDAESLQVYLVYSDRYQVGWRIAPADWDKYMKDKDWEALKASESWWVGIWDNDDQAYLTGSTLTKFFGKNFGGGVWAEPKFPGPVTGGGYGSVTISPTDYQTKLKGAATLTITILDKQQQPVENADLEIILLGTATASRVVPKATSTNAKGVASVNFTAGNTDGVAIVVAKSRGTYGVATIKVGKGDKDPAASPVIAALAAKGYKVNGAGISPDDPNAAYADMDVVGYVADADGNLDPQTTGQVVDGWSAVLAGYSKAKTLIVATRYQGKYGIWWSTSPDDFNSYYQKKTDADTFWRAVLASLKVYDLATGKEVSADDFMSKNFGGG